ncbi:hypothetical protein [Microbacterium testaceum]|uniref:hypothetical protein n=1 Tax=Microbacterium testaceum TaxID=2033 RepID=UPI0022E036D9|nr:hypothetical protein [Microbacterium testaceum]
MSVNIRRKVTAISLMFVAATLTSCGTSQGVNPSAEQVEVQLTNVMYDTADQLDVGEWSPIGGRPRPAPCTGTETSKFGWSIGAESQGEEPLEDAKVVRDYWRSLGMDARLVEGPNPAVYGSGAGTAAIEFSSGPRRYSIWATSLCAIGNSADLEHRPTLPPR